jgi:hypothetical protein
MMNGLAIREAKALVCFLNPCVGRSKIGLGVVEFSLFKSNDGRYFDDYPLS